MKRYKDEAPPLLQWYEAYCTAHKQTPRSQPPIKVLYSCRRMMDPNAPSAPTRADRRRLTEHFSKPGQVWVSVNEHTGKPLDPTDPIADYHSRRNQGEHMPICLLATALGCVSSTAKRKYQQWRNERNEVCIPQRSPRVHLRGVKSLNAKQIAEVLQLYTVDLKSVHYLSKQFHVDPCVIQKALTDSGVHIRTHREACDIRWGVK